MTNPPLPPFDFASTYRDGNPYPIYDRYRERDPVHVIGPTEAWMPAQGPGVFLFSHADNMKWLRDPRMKREWRQLQTESGDADSAAVYPEEFGTFRSVANLFMLFRDPPTHTRRS